MGKIGFIDNNAEQVLGFISKDYTFISDKNIQHMDELTYCKYIGDALYGYKIEKNQPLSDLYDDYFYCVKFFFSNIQAFHLRLQEMHMIEMMIALNNEMRAKGGYYNLRIPTHIIDLVKAYNQCIPKSIFCGGTVEHYNYNRRVDICNEDNITVLHADEYYIKEHQEELEQIAFEVFEDYHSQYHISNVTEKKAGKIYENWLHSSLLPTSRDKIIVAEYNSRPAGFYTIDENEYVVEGVLAAVSKECRKLGVYKMIISNVINYAHEKSKIFVTSTQFDNFVVQGVWSTLGLKPFYSIYNIHVDCR